MDFNYCTAIPSIPQQRESSSDSRLRDDSWYDDDDFQSSEQQRRPARPARRSRESSSSWDDGAGNGWDDSGSSYGGGRNTRMKRDFEPRGGGRGRRNDNFGRGRSDRRKDGPRGRGDFGRGGRGERGGRGRDRREENKPIQSDKGVKTNLREIEAAGYEHLYGIAPVLNALKANIRDFANPEDKEDVDREEMLELQKRLNAVDGSDWGDEEETSAKIEEKKEIKAEAKLAPCLFIQEGTLDNSKRSFRSASKNEASSEIISLAQEIDLNVVEVDKGVLNTLCGNRPHQGFVLRCGGLGFTPLTTRNLPPPNKEGPTLWLALDEVVDPQNLGALLRSAYFLGGGGAVIEDAMSHGGVGILVCSKNSSPLSPAASAASAGALEFMTVYSTNNLPKLLNQAKDDGWRVLGAAAEIPDTGGRRGGISQRETHNNEWDFIDDDDNDQPSDITEYATPLKQNEDEEQKCYNLNEVEVGKPTVLVLGSEGKGLRKLVARACSDFVKIPGGSSIDNHSQAGVDSLNVSVSGGIFLFHFCGRKM